MNLKIGRYEYIITAKDKFMDNGACIQLLTQSKEKSTWGRRPSPVLSKRAIKEIKEYTKIQHQDHDETGTQIFSLDL